MSKYYPLSYVYRQQREESLGVYVAAGKLHLTFRRSSDEIMMDIVVPDEKARELAQHILDTQATREKEPPRDE